jgi:hypothetical protein
MYPDDIIAKAKKLVSEAGHRAGFEGNIAFDRDQIADYVWGPVAAALAEERAAGTASVKPGKRIDR